MQLRELETTILQNRGDAEVIQPIIDQLSQELVKLDWEMEQFLEKHCQGWAGLKRLEVNASVPHYRFYNSKCRDYYDIERLIRVAKAFL